MVANGSKIQSEGTCNSITLKVQHNTIITNFYFITLRSYDIVLGVEWLRTLGSILRDFSIMTMQYSLGGHTILLYGLNPKYFTIEEEHHFLKPSSSSNKGLLLQILVQDTDYADSLIPRSICPLLTEFGTIFEEPQRLPPPRTHDHHIQLK